MWNSVGVLGRMVQEQKADERSKLENRACVEVPMPVAVLEAESSRHGSDDDSNDGCNVRQNNTDVSPLVRKQLTDRKGSHLTWACEFKSFRIGNNLLQLAAPNPTTVIPAVTVPASFATPITIWPTKQMRFPMTRNQRRPRRSVLGPLINPSASTTGLSSSVSNSQDQERDCNGQGPGRYPPDVFRGCAHLSCNLALDGSKHYDKG
jgi:hypothetical protein